MSKRCPRCGEAKPLDEFYKDKSKKDGHKSYCKACVLEKSRQWSAANPGRAAARTRQWAIDNPERAAANGKRWYADNLARAAASSKQWKQDHPEEVAAHNAEWQARNPLKRKAGWAVSNAIRSGKLIKPDTCSECGIDATLDGHHPDYSKPLEVMWLCRKCHAAWHKEHGTDLNGEVTRACDIEHSALADALNGVVSSETIVLPWLGK